MKAKSRNAKSETATATAVAAVAAVAPKKDAPKKDAPKTWDANLGKMRDDAVGGVLTVCRALDGIEASAKSAALAMHRLYRIGHHTVAGWSNFADWFIAASAANGASPNAKTVYRSIAAGAALDAMGTAAAEECRIPMDALAANIGALRKDKKSPEAIGSILRTRSKNYNAARAAGKSSDAAMQDAGIRVKKSPTDPGADLDAEAKAKKCADLAWVLSGQSTAEAVKMLHSAIDRLKSIESAAIRAAKGT